jgi:hypothetical protein
MNRLSVLVLLALALSSRAEAAVRICAAPVSSGPQRAANEKDGQRLALEAWQKAATAIGPGYTAWRLALAKDLRCLKGRDAQIVCEAVGRPCTIQQVPSDTLPPISPKDQVPETKKGLQL